MTYFTDNLTREEDEIREEMRKQNAKWGEQNHPDGTGAAYDSGRHMADTVRRLCQQAAAEGSVTWRHILTEEVYEAFAEDDPERLDEELRQVEAVARQWRLAIRRRLSQVVPVRIDSLFGLIKQQDISVIHPDWNDGRPVELTELQAGSGDLIDVTYGDPETHGYVYATVSADTLVTPVGGA